MRKIAGSLKEKLSSLLQSRAPTPSLIDVNPTTKAGTRWVVESLSHNYCLTSCAYFELVGHSIWLLPQRLPLRKANQTKFPLHQGRYLLCRGNLVLQNRKICTRSATILRSWPLLLIIAHLVSVSGRPEFNSTTSIHRIGTEYLGELLTASFLSFYWWSVDSEFWVEFVCEFPEYTHHRWHFCKFFP